MEQLFGTVTGKRLAILGFAFKADTNDTREAPAIRIARDLLEEGVSIRGFPRVLFTGLLRPPAMPEDDGDSPSSPDIGGVLFDGNG